MLLEQAKEMLMLAKQEFHSAQYATYKSTQIKNTAVSVTNEVMKMIAKVRGRKGRLDLPIVSGKHLKTVHLSKRQKLNQLKELSKMYALYAPIQAAYKESQSLKGFAKMKYDREHKDSLSKYPELKERMQSLLQNGEKITPKQWKAEIHSLQSEYDRIGKEQTKTATELAYVEFISYNKKNLERELQNESRQYNRLQSRLWKSKWKKWRFWLFRKM
jgi:hypothetical protein